MVDLNKGTKEVKPSNEANYPQKVLKFTREKKIDLVGIFIVLLIIQLITKDFFPFNLFSFFYFKFDFVTVLPYIAISNIWAALTFGVSVTWHVIRSKKIEILVLRNAEDFLRTKIWSSLLMAVFVDAIYRKWLLFFSTVVCFKVLNFVLFGVLEKIFQSSINPFINEITQGILVDFLMHPSGWVVGAAVIFCSLNIKTKNFIAAINIWLFEMFLFLILFRFDLYSVFLVNIIFDITFITLSYFFIKIVRSREKTF